MSILLRCSLCCLIVLLPACLAAGAGQDKSLTLTGVVLDPQGKPVAGAQVFGGPDAATGKPIAATSDEAGRFSVTIHAPPQLMGVKEGYAFGWGVLVGRQIVIRLGENPWVLRGRVQTPDGQPLANATVRMHVDCPDPLGASEFPLDFDPRGTPLTTATDATGAFAIAGLPRELEGLLVAAAEGYASQFASFAEGPDVVISLPPEAVISGRVVQGQKPVPNVRVQADLFEEPSHPGYQTEHLPFIGTPSGVTDATGSFTIRGLGEGTRHLRIDPPAGFVAEHTPEVSLKAGQHATDVVIKLTTGGVVDGVVLFDDRKPADGVNVMAFGATAQDRAGFHSTFTDANGKYAIRLPAGEYMVGPTASDFGEYETTRDQAFVKVQAGKHVQANFSLKRITGVVGTVLDPDGKPVAGAQVRRLDLDPDEGPTALVTKVDGTFELPRDAGWGDGPLGAVVVTDRAGANCGAAIVEREMRRFAVTLAPAAWMRGIVADPEQKPLKGVTLIASLEREGGYSYPIATAVSDEQGAFRLGPLPANSPLWARVEDRFERWVVNEEWQLYDPKTLTPGQELPLPPLTIDPRGRSLRVFVGDADQRPVKGALVLSPPLDPVKTDEKGQVEVTGLPPRDKVLIIAMHPSKPLFAAAMTDPNWGQWPGLLLQSLGTATGVLHDPQGKPLARTQVDVSGDDPYGGFYDKTLSKRMPQGYESEETVTDANGRWRAGHLISGMSYTVRVREPTAPGETIFAPAGTFVATGGDNLQDVGTMTFPPPAPEE